ncbi:MAG TPA: glycosyltransferase [Candidatus Angelobacter sp.]
MRVMHVITDLTTGGAQMMLLKLLSSQSADSQPAVVSLADEGSLGPQISALGVRVCSLGLRRSAPNPFRALALRGMTRRILPEIIQGWMYHGNMMASLAGFWSKKKVPVLWNIRQTLYDIRSERRMTAAVIRLNARRSQTPAAIIYNSRTSAEQHETFGFQAAKRVLIPNGFDCEIFRPDRDAHKQVRAEFGVSPDAVMVGLIARYHPMKDHVGFLRAASLVVSHNPNVYFLLAGKGVSLREPALEKAVAEHRLRDKVFLLGERSDVPRLTAALDIACSASAWGEGFSNAIGEAMSCGVPCVVTDIGDSAHIVGDSGLTVAPRSPEALAEAIDRLIEIGQDQRQKLGERARRRIESEFSLSAVVRRYEDLYRTLVSDRQS